MYVGISFVLVMMVIFMNLYRLRKYNVFTSRFIVMYSATSSGMIIVVFFVCSIFSMYVFEIGFNFNYVYRCFMSGILNIVAFVSVRAFRFVVGVNFRCCVFFLLCIKYFVNDIMFSGSILCGFSFIMYVFLFFIVCRYVFLFLNFNCVGKYVVVVFVIVCVNCVFYFGVVIVCGIVVVVISVVSVVIVIVFGSVYIVSVVIVMLM